MFIWSLLVKWVASRTLYIIIGRLFALDSMMPRGLICKLLTCNLGKVISNFKTRHKLEYFWQKTHWNKMKERAQAIKKRGFFEYSLLPISFLHTSQQAMHDLEWIFNPPPTIVLLLSISMLNCFSNWCKRCFENMDECF